MYKIFLNSPFDRLWQSQDAFAAVSALSGELFRKVKSRNTFRIEVDGKGFFVKHHRGIGWYEIFKDLLQFKKPVTGARGEYEAIRRLEELEVPTMNCAAFGERGWNPAAKESFIITRELKDMFSVEELYQHDIDFTARLDIADKLGCSVGKMHAGGVNHRDCYICHFLRSPENQELYVIDLHRAQIRKKVPRRYAVKDAAGIVFSAAAAGAGREELERFFKSYAAAGNPDTAAFRRSVLNAARKLYRKEYSKDLPDSLK